VSVLGKLAQARAELDARHDDPWCKKVEAVVRGMDAVSTAALLDLLRAPATTATARRLAAVMRGLNFIPIKSRRLMPGGRTGNTVTRGWARPLRTTKSFPQRRPVPAEPASTNRGHSHDLLAFKKL
jgi:hypothetical protein